MPTNGKSEALARRPARAPVGSPDNSLPLGLRIKEKRKADRLKEQKKKAKLQRPKSRKEQEIFDRRMRIYQLRQRGYTYERISKELDITYVTVKKDMDAITEMARGQVVDFDAPMFIAKELAGYDDLIKSGWKEYERGANGIQRVKALEFIRQTKSDKVKALKDVGVVSERPKDATNVQITAAVIKGWTPEVQAAASKALLETMLSGDLPEPVPEEGPKVIEAESQEAPADSGGSNGTS